MRWTQLHCQTCNVMRTAKACGPGTPGLVLRSQVMILRTTVTNKVMDTGESAQEPVNTIAQGMPVNRLDL